MNLSGPDHSSTSLRNTTHTLPLNTPRRPMDYSADTGGDTWGEYYSSHFSSMCLGRQTAGAKVRPHTFHLFRFCLHTSFSATTTTTTLQHERTRTLVFEGGSFLPSPTITTLEHEHVRSFSRVVVVCHHHHLPPLSDTSTHARFRGWLPFATTTTWQPFPPAFRHRKVGQPTSPTFTSISTQEGGATLQTPTCSVSTCQRDVSTRTRQSMDDNDNSSCSCGCQRPNADDDNNSCSCNCQREGWWLSSTTTTFRCHRKRALTLVFEGGGRLPPPAPSAAVENECSCSFSRVFKYFNVYIIKYYCIFYINHRLQPVSDWL